MRTRCRASRRGCTHVRAALRPADILLHPHELQPHGLLLQAKAQGR